MKKKLLIEIDDIDFETIKHGKPISAKVMDALIHGKPLPEGHWTERTMHSNGFFMPNCSECGRMQPYAHHIYQPNFCPNCGADMRKAESEDKE